MNVFSGNPSLFICPGFFSLSTCIWKLNEDTDKELIIKEAERKNLNATWYLFINSSIQSSYGLLITKFESGNKLLDLGITELNSLSSDEIMNYNLFIYDQKARNVSLSLTNKQGNVDLIIKRCLEENCKITLKDFTNDLTNYMSKIRTNETNSFFNFLHDINLCKIKEESKGFFWNLIKKLFEKDSLPNSCHYLIGIRGISKTLNKYELLLTYENQMMNLNEKDGLRNNINMNHYQYYHFKLLNDELIESVSFQITAIIGDVQSFASRNVERPTEGTYEKKTNYYFDSIEYKATNEKISLYGDYFISVKGVTSAYYSILPIIRRKLKAEREVNVIRLFQGVGQKISYQSNKIEWNYFKFDIDLSDKNQHYNGFNLQLSANKGDFEYFIGADMIPNETNFTLTSFKNSLFINITDPIFLNKTHIFIAIKNKHATNSTMQNFEYLISFGGIFTISPIKIGSPLVLDLKANESRFYSVEILSSYAHNLTFTHNNMNDLRIFISNSNQYPNSTAHDYEMTSNYFILDYEKALHLCSNPINCKLFIAIYALNHVSFSFSLQFQETEVSLKQGMPIQLPITEPNEPPFKIFTFISNYTSSLLISSYSLYRKCFIYANIIQLDHDFNKENWLFPTSTKFEFSSFNLTSSLDSSSLLITPEIIANHNCIHAMYGCVVTMRVYPFESTSPYYSLISKPTFSISVSSEVLYLTDSVPHIDYVNEKSYKYFSIYVPSSVDLFITLTPLSSGDPDLCVSFGDESRPTLDNNDWVVRTFGGEQLEITPDMLFTRKQKKLPGTYVIGVFGYRNCSFSIAVTYGNIKILKIRTGTPIELILNKDRQIYLEYNHFLDHSFKLLVTETSVPIDIFVSTRKDKEGFVDRLPNWRNASSYQWNNVDSAHKNVFPIYKSSKDFCFSCTYYIGFRNEVETQFTVLIQILDFTNLLQTGIILNNWLEKYESNKYYFNTKTGNVDITIIVYSGVPTVYFSKHYFISETLYTLKKVKSTDSNIIFFKVFNENPFKSPIDGYSYSLMISTENSQSCNYTVSVKDYLNEKYLKYGVLDYVSLSSNESQIYSFSGYLKQGRNEKEPNQSISINIFIQENILQKDFLNEFQYNYPIVQISLYDEERNFKKKIENYKESLSLQLMNYILPSENGIYFLNVTNHHNSQFNFSILLNNIGLNTIFPNNENFGIVPLNQTNNYEIYSISPGKLLIEVFECSGKLELYTTNTYDNLMQSKYEQVITNQSENRAVTYLTEINDDLLFIGLKAVESNEALFKKWAKKNEEKLNDGNNINGNDSFYKVKTNLLSKDAFSPYESFSYNNKLNWKMEKEFLQIFFQTVSHQNRTGYKPMEYIYQLFISDSVEVLHSVLKCNTPLNNDKKEGYISLNYASLFFNNKTHPSKASFIIKLSNLEEKIGFNLTQNLFFSIQTKVLVKSNDDKFLTLTFIYELNEFFERSRLIYIETSYYLQLTIFIFSFIVLILGLCGLFYWRRYKRIKNLMNFEVDQTQNSTLNKLNSSLKVTGGKTPHYLGFVEDKNETSVND